MKRLILISACVAATSYAFAQQPECVKTTVNLTGNQMTLTTSGAKSSTLREHYVYYERKRQKKNENYVVPGASADRYPSEPLMLNSWQDVAPVAEKYNVTVVQPEHSVAACADSSVNLTAALSVERVASFTGNYPAKTDKVYHKVSKRDYKMAARKKRKIERKEEKIARRAEVNVEVKSTGV